MTRVVETAMVDFKVQVRVEKVITKTPEGALRYRQIAVGLGKPVPVPSILVNGHLVYERIPGVDELKQTIHLMVKQLE